MRRELEPHSYRNFSDFEKVKQLLMLGRQANNGTYYFHVGDVQWWLFYPDESAEFPERIVFWEEGDEVLGWCLFTPKQNVYDLVVHPRLRGSSQAEEMEVWAETHLIEMVKASGGNKVGAFWITDSDEVRMESFKRRGYGLTDDVLNCRTRSLSDLPAIPMLPDGYVIRGSAGEQEAEERARASHAAFKSKWEWGAYMQRRLSFMHSPVYEAERDRVVATPDGRIASFCICWLDPVNKIGLFEPVGTQPDFQGQGFGKALMIETLHWLKAQGMESAMVCAEAANPASNRLYESVGFQMEHRLVNFEKEI
jgi:mycothiol synthase